MSQPVPPPSPASTVPLPDSLAGMRIARAFDRLRDVESVERLAVGLAVDSAIGRFEHAWMLEWNAREGVLQGAAEARAGDAERAEATLDPASDVHGAEAVRALRVPPLRLDATAGHAWNGTTHEAAAEGALPWRGEPHVAAVCVRRGTLPAALLVVAGAGNVASLDVLAERCAVAFERLDAAAEQRRLERQVATVAEAMRASVSAVNVAEALQAVARLAVQATGARGGALWVDRGGDAPKLEVTHGMAPQRDRIGRALGALATATWKRGQLRVVDPAAEEPMLAPEVAAQLHVVALVPLVAFGRSLGVLAVYDRAGTRPWDPPAFDAADLECLAALADAAAAALDQARRFQALETAAIRQRELARRLRREERLASVGETAARAARDARNPLASIAAFARRVQRSLPEADPNHDYLDIVIRESERLERLIGESVADADVDPEALELESLNDLVQESLSAVGETLVRRRIRLLKRMSPDVPALLLDVTRMRRVVDNVLASALESVTVGGRIRIETRRAQQWVMLEIGHDGPHEPGDLLEQLFVPFASGRPGGEGIGLGVAQQVVREHGGEIRVRREAEWPALFTLTLPIPDNQDRRRGGPNRRQARRDRRGARPRARANGPRSQV